MTSFERTLLKDAGQGKGAQYLCHGFLHITDTCPTQGCESPSTENYGLVQYCNEQSRKNCASIMLVETSRNDPCDLHRNTEIFEGIWIAHGTEQGRLHIIHRCPIEGCTTDPIDSQAVIKPYYDPKSGKMYTILGQVEALEDKVCELHSKHFVVEL